MSTAWDLLLQHRADILDQLQSARKKAEAPFLAELESTNRALEALRGGRRGRKPGAALCEAEPQAFAAAIRAATATPRGRQRRSLKEMVQIALRSHAGPMDLETLTQALEQRWNRAFSASQVELQLIALKQEGAAEADGETWMALERRTEPRGEPAQASSSMSQ